MCVCVCICMYVCADTCKNIKHMYMHACINNADSCRHMQTYQAYVYACVYIHHIARIPYACTCKHACRYVHAHTPHAKTKHSH